MRRRRQEQSTPRHEQVMDARYVERIEQGGQWYDLYEKPSGEKFATPVTFDDAESSPKIESHVADMQSQPKVSPVEQVADDENPTEFFNLGDIPAQATPITTEEYVDIGGEYVGVGDVGNRLAEARALRDAVGEEVSKLEQEEARQKAELERQRKIEAAEALAEAERKRQAAAVEAEQIQQKKVAAAMRAFRNQGQDPITAADVQRIRQMTQLDDVDVAGHPAVGEESTAGSEDISASLSMEEWTNNKQAEYIPSADDILRGARASSRMIDFVKKRPALTGIGFLAVAATIATPLGMSQLNASPQEIATNVTLELPKGGIELASECITLDEYDKAPAKQSIDGVVPFDLKKPDGKSYKFNDDKGTVRTGNDIVLTGAEAYLGACAVDEKESAVSVDGTTIIIHRDRVKSQLVVAPSDTEGAIAAQPVNADIAGKLVFSQPENQEKLVSYFEGSTFDALVGNSAAAIGEGALQDEVVHAKLDKALDEALVKDLQDDIAGVAKGSKVEADKITTELRGKYSQIEVLNVKKDIEGATVMGDLVTVEVAKGK